MSSTQRAQVQVLIKVQGTRHMYTDYQSMQYMGVNEAIQVLLLVIIGELVSVIGCLSLFKTVLENFWKNFVWKPWKCSLWIRPCHTYKF